MHFQVPTNSIKQLKDAIHSHPIALLTHTLIRFTGLAFSALSGKQILKSFKIFYASTAYFRCIKRLNFAGEITKQKL